MGKKRLLLKRDKIPPLDNYYEVGAVQSPVPMYKLIFDLNYQLKTNLFINRNKIEFKENNLDLYFQNYASKEDFFEPIRVFQNQLAVETYYSGELFSTTKIFYLLPKLKDFSYIFFFPKNHPLSYQNIINEFNPKYYNLWQLIKPELLKPYPIFPEIEILVSH